MALTEEAFKDTFVNYYELLYSYAFSILNSVHSAKETVSDVFYKLWLKKDTLVIDTSLAAYLYKSTHNACMDKIKHHKKKRAFERDRLQQSTENAPGSVYTIDTKDFQKNLRNALLQLPEQCRTVFQLSRMEEMSYKDIAKRLDISVKTVETHMSKALRRLRISLAEFLTLLIFWLWR